MLSAVVLFANLVTLGGYQHRSYWEHEALPPEAR
jgi:hypothetical protein